MPLIMDEAVPDVGVVPLMPTAFKKFKNKIVRNSSGIADWLWKLAENRMKNIYEIADWILDQTDKVVKKVLPKKVRKLIKLSKRMTYNSNMMYWKINIPSDARDEGVIFKKVEEARLKYEKEHYSKYLKMYCYNHITSLDDVHKNLMKTYKEENNAFKLLLSFGYVTEKRTEEQNESDEYIYKIKLYQASQQYFYDKPIIIADKKHMNELINKISKEEVIGRVGDKFKNSNTRLIGVYSMAVKVIRLDYPIGANIQLPDYIKKSNYIIGLEDVDNNFCFWACLALAEGCTKSRYITKAKELFNNFYTKNVKKFNARGLTEARGRTGG